MQQLFVLNQSVTVQIVNFEQEFDFVLGRLAGELMHRVNEFLQCDRSRIVLVEDLENSFVEKWLQVKFSSRLNRKHFECLTFFDITIFLKSSRLISFPSPTVFLNSCSNFSSDVLSKPVFGLVFVMFEMHSMTCVVDTEFVASVSANKRTLVIAGRRVIIACQSHLLADRTCRLSVKSNL